MASFTATTTGNWNIGATWGNVGNDVEGSGYPGNGDAFSVPNGVTVTIPAGTWPSSGAYVLTHASSEVQSGGTLIISDLAYINTTGDGVFTVDSGGTLAAGSVGVGITGRITFTPATDGGAGLVLNGTATIVGLTKDHYKLLAADVGEWAASGDIATVANVTAITLNEAPTGWLENDLLAISPTGRTYSHWDTCLINETPVAGTEIAVDGWQGTAPTYTDGVATKSAWNHQGTGSPPQARAEVLNLTRSFKIYSTDATKRAYITIASTATVQMDYVECYSLGADAVSKYGIVLNTSTGSVSMTGVVNHDAPATNAAGFRPPSSGQLTTGSIALTSCIAWNTKAQGYYVSAWSGAGSFTLTSCIAGNVTTASQYGFNILDVGSTFPGCRAVGNVNEGFYVNEAATIADGMLDGVVSHSNGGAGLYVSTAYGTVTTTIDDLVAWRSASYNVMIRYTGAKFWLAAPILFGATTAEIYTNGAGLTVSSPTAVADSLAGSGVGLYALGGNATILSGSINSTHSIRGDSHVTVNNATWTNFAAPTFTAADTDQGPYLLSFRHNATEDDHRGYFKYGSVLSNATTRHTASGLSWQHNPTGGTTTWFRPSISQIKTGCRANVEITIRVWVYVDASWNGNASYKPRIVCLGKVVPGIDEDAIGTSHTGAQQWEQLTVTVTPTSTGILECVVEAGGTTGSYYIDDFDSI